MSEFGRRQLARRRREYLYRKGQEHRLSQIQARKQRVKSFLEDDKELPGDMQKTAAKLVSSALWDDEGAARAAMMTGESGDTDIDDEYRHGGVEDPKIFLTTSHDPSSRLKMFAKEMKLIFPNCERMNRGNFNLKSLLSSAKTNGFTDVVILHETRGRPDQIVVSHLPNGPTAFFSLHDVKLRHDIPDTGTMSEAYPHLIFHNFVSKLGLRVQCILKYLFPVPKDDSQRVMMFVNHSDWILFRHYVEQRGDNGKNEGVIEVGPQFSMLCHKIILSTLDEEKSADVEHVLRPYENTAHKRLLMAPGLPFSDDEDEPAPNTEKSYDVAT
uniref:U3 small nucleolar ribonucleoprotein protein IMP4-like n=1 Tax=Hirondellea gigas TaxID=1518452 RepID=A0A2P2I3G2_9CRUS